MVNVSKPNFARQKESRANKNVKGTEKKIHGKKSAN